MSKNTKMPAPVPESNVNLLLEGIRADTELKIKAVESQTAAFVSAKLEHAALRVAAIEEESARTIAAREASIKAVYATRLKIEARKLEFEVEERFMRRILALATLEYAKAKESPEYENRVFAWACEAAIGIGSAEIEIKASEAEIKYLNAEFLARVERRVFELSGRSVHLSLSKEPPLDRQGLLLEAEGGRLGYDNSASARLARAENSIRGLIQAALESAKADFSE